MQFQSAEWGERVRLPRKHGRITVLGRIAVLDKHVAILDRCELVDADLSS